MVYLKMLGMELGYLKTKDMEEMAYSAALMIDNLLKMFPTDVSPVPKKKKLYTSHILFVK